jgi:hypothetical protein
MQTELTTTPLYGYASPDNNQGRCYMKGRVCQRSTNRYFIRIYAPGHGEIRVARDEMGRVLDSKERADALLGKIRMNLNRKPLMPLNTHLNEKTTGLKIS